MKSLLRFSFFAFSFFVTTSCLGQAPAISYSTPQTYNVNKAITALAPANTGGAVATAGYGSPVTYGSGGDGSQIGIALDAAGNLYVSDFSLNEVYKIAANGGATTIASNLNKPSAVAVDAVGNLYIATLNGPDSLYKIPAGGGPPVLIFAGLAPPESYQGITSIAVDFAGNIYVSNGGILQKVSAGGGRITQIGATTFSTVQGIALDAAGNLYVADYVNSYGSANIWKVPVNGGPITVFATLTNYADAVVVDANNNVYYLEAYQSGQNAAITNGVFEFPAGDSSPVTIVQGPTNYYTYGTGSGSLAVDGAGNIYVPYVDAPYSIKKIKPAGGYYISPALPAGLSFSNSTGVISGTPIVSSPATNYTVTCYNSVGSSSAIVNIGVGPAVSASLSALTISSGTLTPSFSSATTNYTAVVANSVSSIAITPTTEVNTSTVKVNGIAVSSGTSSSQIALKSGSNVISTVVTAADGATTATYTLTVTKAFPAELDGLSVSVGSLSPTFATATTSYTDSVDNFVTSLTLTPTTVDKYSTVTVNGIAATSGLASTPVPLIVGSNTINVVVTTIDGTSKTYTVVVKRALSTNANLYNIRLSSGTLSPAFSSATTLYTATVINSVSSITIVPTTAVTTSTVTVNGIAVTSGKASGEIALAVGSNSITIEVTAQDGVTTSIYTVNVTRDNVPNTNLSGLLLSNGSLSPSFVSTTTSYTATEANGVLSVTVTPTASDPTSTITINSTAVTSGTASAAIPLNTGLNTITIVVTANDGVTTKTYTVSVTRLESSDASLKALNISTGGLVPAFSSGTLNYTRSVGNGTSSVTVTPTTNDPTATVKVNGAAVASGTASGTISLNVPTTAIQIVVIAQDGTAETYTITVTRAPSSNDYLSSLLINNGTVTYTPAFASATKSYTATVPDTTTVVRITPTATITGSTIKVNGTTVTSGKVSANIPLSVGANSITTEVTAQDGVTTTTYTLNITRSLSTDASLKSLAISTGGLVPVFATGTLNYTRSVGNGTSSVTITPTPTNSSATVKVNGVTVAAGTVSGVIALNVGNTVINTVVTAQDGKTTETYTITVTRASSSNDYLSSLKINNGSVTFTPAFASTTKGYSASVPNTTASVTITPTATVAASAITVNGITVASGAASAAIPLVTGANTITTVVTAQDGITTFTYTVTVTRALSADASLYALKISTGGLVPVFAAGTLNYTRSVGNGTSTITATPTTTNAAATVTVNGMSLPSGTTSGLIALNVGTTIINIVVTAQDGITTETYTVTVTRAAPADNSLYQAVSVENPLTQPQLTDDGLFVHQAVSPNGDGINDFLTIENIGNYPDNKLMIMNRNGQLVFEGKNYDNNTRVFDGHSNKTGQMQLPGTYFYALDYTVKGITKHKTGFLILKY